MKQLILNIKEEKYSFLLELIQNLDFVQFEASNYSGDSKEEILKSLKQAFQEFSEYKIENLELKKAQHLLDEL